MPKIMLVEDDNNLREIYGARLQAEGHTIVSANDGEEALALAVKEKPDLIISDVMMPKISGFDMLDILRSTPETKNTKVIMMTALSQAEDKSRADKLGADLYLVKSQVTLEDVAKAVDRVLTGEAADSQQADGTEAQPAGETSSPKLETTAPAPEPEAVPTPEPAPEQSDAPAVAPTPESQSEQTNPPQQQTTPVEAPSPESQPNEQKNEEAAAADGELTPEPSASPDQATESNAPAKKIEVTEHSEPEAETPVQSESKPTLQSAPLEVVLPSSPDEADSGETKSAKETAASPQPEVGPNLNEVLTGEAKESEPAPEPKPEIEKREETPSQEESKPETSEPASSAAQDTKESSANPIDEGTRKKVIQPINNPENQKDIVQLAEEEEAKEEANEAVQNPPADSVVEPETKPDDNQGSENNSPGSDDKPPTDDFSKIAL